MAVAGEEEGGEAELVCAKDAGVGVVEALDDLWAGMAEGVVEADGDDGVLRCDEGEELGGGGGSAAVVATLSSVSGPSWAESEMREADPSLAPQRAKTARRGPRLRYGMTPKGRYGIDKARDAATICCSLGASASPSSRAEEWPKVRRITSESLLMGGPGLVKSGVGASTVKSIESQAMRSPARRWRTRMPRVAASASRAR